MAGRLQSKIDVSLTNLPKGMDQFSLSVLNVRDTVVEGKFKNLVEHWADFKDQLQMYIEKLESWKAFHEAANECQRLLVTLEKGYQEA